jgi:hypothetical protein
MKNRLVVFLIAVGLMSTVSFGDCVSLMAKYNAPDPSIKTMRQLKRWVKRKVKDENKAKVEKCLIDRAADNPNKSTVAGE